MKPKVKAAVLPKKSQGGAAATAPPEERAEPVLRKIALGLIIPSTTNPRKSFPEESLQELAESIRLDGVKVPLAVRPIPQYTLREPDLVDKRWVILCDGFSTTWDWDESYGPDEAKERLKLLAAEQKGAEYEIVAGERRWRAAKIAGLKEVPCLIEFPADDQTRRRWQLIENDQREDLNPLDRAQAYQDYINQTGCTMEEFCAEFGKQRSTVYDVLALLKAAPAVKEAVQGGKISESVARSVTRHCKTPEAQAKALGKVEKLSARQAEVVLKELSGKPAKPKATPQTETFSFASPPSPRPSPPGEGEGTSVPATGKPASAATGPMLFATFQELLQEPTDTLILSVSKSGKELRVMIAPKFFSANRDFKPVVVTGGPEKFDGPLDFKIGNTPPRKVKPKGKERKS
jgi:ParB/RepB/Spo0J family partition protein